MEKSDRIVVNLFKVFVFVGEQNNGRRTITKGKKES
jgi:hypothetical protein